MPDGDGNVQEMKEVGQTLVNTRTMRLRHHFLGHLYDNGGVIRDACRAMNLKPGWPYQQGEDFMKAVKMTVEKSTDLLLQEAQKRAVEGTIETVEKFTLVEDDESGTAEERLVERTTRQRKSDQLLTFLIKGRDPAYRDNVKHEHSGSVGGAAGELPGTRALQCILGLLAAGTEIQAVAGITVRAPDMGTAARLDGPDGDDTAEDGV